VIVVSDLSKLKAAFFDQSYTEICANAEHVDSISIGKLNNSIGNIGNIKIFLNTYNFLGQYHIYANTAFENLPLTVHLTV